MYSCLSSSGNLRHHRYPPRPKNKHAGTPTNNSSAKNISAQITGFDELNENISKWNDTSWDSVNGCWENYSGTGTGINFTVNTFDVIRVNLSDAVGTQTISMFRNVDINYNAERNVTLVNESYNKGYNFTGYTSSLSTNLGTINGTFQELHNYYIYFVVLPYEKVAFEGDGSIGEEKSGSQLISAGEWNMVKDFLSWIAYGMLQNAWRDSEHDAAKLMQSRNINPKIIG